MHCTLAIESMIHGFVVLCFAVIMQSFITNSHEVFIHIHQGCFAGTGTIVRLPQCQWSKPDGYGKISQCITTTKHSKAKTVCIFLGLYCMNVSWFDEHSLWWIDVLVEVWEIWQDYRSYVNVFRKISTLNKYQCCLSSLCNVNNLYRVSEKYYPQDPLVRMDVLCIPRIVNTTR